MVMMFLRDYLITDVKKNSVNNNMSTDYTLYFKKSFLTDNHRHFLCDS